MTTSACSKWGGLFSVEDLDDEDLLEADWTHSSASESSAVPACAPLEESHTVCSHDAQHSSIAPSANFPNSSSVPDSSAQLHLSESRPIKGLRSLANPRSSSISHTNTVSHASLRAPYGGANASTSLQHLSNSPLGQSNSQPGVCNVSKKDIPAQDDFDDWDVDLEELDECVPQKASAPGTNLGSDSISPAKRTRLSDVCEDTPTVSSLRGFCKPAPKSAPQQTFIRSPCSTRFYPQNNPQPCVPPACRFTSPVTPGPLRVTSKWQRGAVTPRPEHCSLFQAVSPAPSTLHPPHPLHMPVLTNHLVQLVSAATKTPQRPRSNTVQPKTRRFPGPAGALPQQISGRSLDDIVVAVPQTPAHGAVARLRSEVLLKLGPKTWFQIRNETRIAQYQVPSSQINDEEEFSVGPWAAMKAEMGLDESNPSCFLHSHSIVMVLRKAALRQLSKNKVPNMAVVLKSILHTHADAKALFKDPTDVFIYELGEMQGTVHRRLLEDRQGELKTGAVLLLKQVGVFSPSNRNHYLNVTPNNLLRIYCPDGAVHVSSQNCQLALEPVGLLHCDSSKPEGGPVSQMELQYDDEEEEEEAAEEQSSRSAKPLVSAKAVVQSTAQNDCSEDAQWDADDLDELLGELPVESYCA